MDITTIPTDELINDRGSSISDIKTCELALLHGIEQYSGGSVKDRLETNKRIVMVIDKELQRREQAIIDAGGGWSKLPSGPLRDMFTERWLQEPEEQKRLTGVG